MHLLFEVVVEAVLIVLEVYIERDRSEISDARRVEIPFFRDQVGDGKEGRLTQLSQT